MAENSTIRKTSEVNKGGRPRGSGRAPAGPVQFDYSRSRQSISKFQEFGRYLAGYPDLTGLWAYWYRLKPRLDLQLIGLPESYIWKTSKPEEMTEEFIMGKFGNGEFQLKLTDANRPKGEQECCKTWLVIEDPDLKPIYDPRALVIGHEKNADEVARLMQLGVLLRDSSTGLPRLRTDADPPAPVGAHKAFSGSSAQSSGPSLSGDVLGQIVLGMINRNVQSPGDVVKDTIAMANLLRPAMDVDAIVEKVAARLAPAQNGTSEQNMFQIWERVEGFIAKVRPSPPAGAGDGAAAPNGATNGASSWAPYLAGIIGQVRAALPEIVSTVKTLRVDRAVTQGTNGGRPMPQNRILPFEERLQVIAEMGLREMETGTKGFDYATYICMHYPGGLEVYRTLEPGGTDGLISMLAMNPATKHLTTDAKSRAQLESFLNDFFEFDTSKLDAALAATGAAETSTPSAG